jgi:HEAT repeat protein
MALWNLALSYADIYYRNKKYYDELTNDPVAAAKKGFYKCSNCGKICGKIEVCPKCGTKIPDPLKIASQDESKLPEKTIESFIYMLWNEDPNIRMKANLVITQKMPGNDVIEWIRRCNAGPVCMNPEGHVKSEERISYEVIVDILLKAMRDTNPKIRSDAIFAFNWIKSDRAIYPLILALNDDSSDVRWSALRALLTIKPDNIVELLVRLTLIDNEEQIREFAVENINELKFQEALPLFRDALHDPDKIIRSNAAFALGYISYENFEVDLLRALDDDDSNVRKNAARSLGKIKSEKAIDPLIQTIIHDTDIEAREMAAIALGMDIGSENVVNSLIPLLKNEDPIVRQCSCEALGNIASKRAIVSLLPLLNDPDPDVQSSAVRALGCIQSEEAIDELIILLHNGDFRVRSSAAFALGWIKTEKAVDPLIQTLDDNDASVRQRSAEALGRIGSKKAVAPLLQHINDNVKEVRQEIFMALGDFKSEDAVDPLLQILREDLDPKVRWFAANALYKIKSENSVDPLVQILLNNRKCLNNQGYALGIKETVEAILGAIKSERSVNPLVNALNHGNSEVRRSAANVLGLIGFPMAVEPLRQVVSSDKDLMVRQAAQVAISKIQEDKKT